ncbi:MAG: hypothetical protein KDC87_01690 [Planctomycetes bacterium]|nr:hypothetical protein [Planctomycetota bacterium]MCB9870938.1 hypothetical protein [Planctomycetota bacterium]MCB9888302.1 hypothetical protein [Planctomycetota bacterium]
MPSHLYQFRCPCCHKKLEFDADNGRARVVEPGEGEQKVELDQLLDQHRQESARLDNAFDRAVDAQQRQAERFDDLLAEAKEKAKHDKSKPRNPFDLE